MSAATRSGTIAVFLRLRRQEYEVQNRVALHGHLCGEKLRPGRGHRHRVRRLAWDDASRGRVRYCPVDRRHCELWSEPPAMGGNLPYVAPRIPNHGTSI